MQADLSYIENNSLTIKGNFACSVYGYELILSELHHKGILESLDRISLGILCVAIVFEPRKNQHMKSMTKDCLKLNDLCEHVYSIIKNKEIYYQIMPISKKPYFHLSKAVKAWLAGMNFSKIRDLTDTDEGEIIRYFRMAVQLLREIGNSNCVSFDLSRKTSEAIKILNRDIVDAEKQLRS